MRTPILPIVLCPVLAFAICLAGCTKSPPPASAKAPEPKPPATAPTPTNVKSPPTPPKEETPAPVITTGRRPLSPALRVRLEFPRDVTLTAPTKVELVEGGSVVGATTLAAGRRLMASGLSDDGMLAISLRNSTVNIPYENTDLLESITTVKTTTRPAVQAARPSSQPTRTNVATNQRQQAVGGVKTSQIANPEQRLLELKARFPKKQMINVQVTVRDPGRTKVVVRDRVSTYAGPSAVTSSATSVQDGNRYHYDTNAVDVPHADIWSNYRGWVQAATLESLPRTLQKLDDQIEDDMIRLRGQIGVPSAQSQGAQAAQTIQWINQTFRPYLNQLRALTK